MRHSRFRFVSLGVVSVLLLAACGGSSGTPSPTAKQLKIGLVTDTGGLNDRSFNHLAYVGLQKAIKDFGVKGDVTESTKGDDYVPNLTNYASKNYDLVIGVGFLMQEAVGTVSGQFPSIHFAIIDGCGTDKNFVDLKHSNVMCLHFKEQESGALVGVIAGALEKSGATPKKQHTVGAVGGISIPPVNRYIAGYKWAVKQQDPSATVLIGYSNNFNDPTKCAGVAQSQISHNADILFQVAGGCGLGVLQSAGQAHVYSIGVDADQGFADTSVIASALKKVDVATYSAIKAVHDGTFTGGDVKFSLLNDATGYQLDNAFQLPADVKAAVDDMMAKIKSGAATPPEDIPTP